MTRYLTGVMVAVLAAAVLFTAPAFADHRPGNVVVIGGSWALSGGYAEAAGVWLAGRKLYVEGLNARGGLLGHKVELRILDDKSDRRTAIEIYEKLITEDAVDLILGHYSSSMTDAVANVMERYRRPFIVPAAVSPAIFQRGRRQVFRAPLAVSQDYQKGALHVAKELGVRRIAIIGEVSLFPRQVTVGALEWAKKLGLEVVLLENYHKERTDFTALLRSIEASGAEAIFSNGYYLDAVAQTRQLRELDINVKLFSPILGPATPKFVEELGAAAEFVLGFSLWEPRPALGHPGVKEFIEHYEKRFGEKPNYRAATSHAEMQIYEAAVKQAGSFDPGKMRDALASITVQTVMGPWKVDERGFMSIDGLAIQIQNGARVIVWPEDKAEARVLPMPKWEDRAKK